MDARSVSLTLLNAVRRGLESASVPTETPDKLSDFLRLFGYEVTYTQAEVDTLKAFMGLQAPLHALNGLVTIIETGGGAEEAVDDLLQALIALSNSIKAWSSGGIGALPAPFNQAAFWNTFLEDLLNLLVAGALHADAPKVYSVLYIFGIIDYENTTPAGANRINYDKTVVRWNKLGELLTDPGARLKDSFGYGLPGRDFNHKKFVEALAAMGRHIGFQARLDEPSSALLDIYYTAGNTERAAVRQLQVPFLFEVGPNFSSFAELGISMLPITPKGNKAGKPNGFAIMPLVRGGVTGSTDPNAEWRLEASAEANLDGLFRMEVRPDSFDMAVSGGAISIKASLKLIGHFANPKVLIGAANSHRIEVEGVFISVEIKGPIADPEFVVKIGTGEGDNAPRIRFILQGGDGDSFINKLIGTQPQSIDFSGFLSFSTKHGIGFGGNVGFHIDLPLHIALGPIEFESLRIAADKHSSGGMSIPVGINIKGQLGPLSAVVEDIGVKMIIQPKSSTAPGGLFGNMDVSWEFKPPTGIGLSIDGGGFKGGGFLSFDYEQERYSGMLELEFQNTIAIRAIGLLTTKMPDGSKGFSLLILITAEFTPIQLGFGFTLNGVGGLLGLNRTMVVEKLREGVRTGALNSVLFPQDIIANANRIISDLNTIFPPQEGKFIFGPMAKIGWGTPTLLTVELGLLIEVPDPVRIAILGVVRLVLPDEQVAILKIQVNFLGTIEFDKKLLAFDASLFDSRILTMTLEGDMALRVAWGDNANFLLTVGGFHPAYQPPPLALPALRRLSLAILPGENPRLRVECYFATTSNTVQFGAKLELYAKAWKFSVEGWLGFDALFQFSPFYFIISVSAGLKVKCGSSTLFGITLAFTLEGPTPWHAYGKATFTILFFDVSVSFDETWGERKDTTLPDKAVYPALRTALLDKRNWKAELPARSRTLVTLRDLSKEAEVVAHPAGSLTVSQKEVPLKMELQKYGAYKPADGKTFKIESVTSDGDPLKIEDVREQFAPAQFKTMDNAAKLSSPSFSDFPAGVKIVSSENELKSHKLVRRDVAFETIIIDQKFLRNKLTQLMTMVTGIFNFLLKGSAITKSELSYEKVKEPVLAPGKVKFDKESFVVVNTATLKPFDPGSVLPTKAEADEYLENLAKTNPKLRSQLQTVPSFQASAL